MHVNVLNEINQRRRHLDECGEPVNTARTSRGEVSVDSSCRVSWQHRQQLQDASLIAHGWSCVLRRPALSRHPGMWDSVYDTKWSTKRSIKSFCGDCATMWWRWYNRWRCSGPVRHWGGGQSCSVRYGATGPVWVRPHSLISGDRSSELLRPGPRGNSGATC